MGQAYSVWVCCALDTGGVSGGVCFSPMLKFLSINANGLRDKAKVDVLSCQCSLLTFDVLLLQETHLTTMDEGFFVAEKLLSRGFGHWVPPTVVVLAFLLANASTQGCPSGTRREVV